MFFKFLVGIFSFFIVPFLIIFCRNNFNNISQSLKLSLGLILSLSLCWIVFFISFYLEISNRSLFAFSCLLSIYGLYLILKNYEKFFLLKEITLVLLVVICVLLIVFLLNSGRIFTQWDAVVSWNRWALEFYNNEYNPVNAAYPILIPAIWSILYKVQGSSEIWWTVKLSLFFIPFITVFIINSIYKETKNLSFLYILFFTLIYTSWSFTYSGYMDTQMLILGILSLTLLKASECKEYENSYDLCVYSALIISGISTIIKQPGLAFLCFNILYICFFSLQKLNSKKFLFFCVFIGVLYFLSFLLLYFNFQTNIIGNIDILKKLSYQNSGNYFFDLYNLVLIFFKNPLPLLIKILLPFSFILLLYVNKNNLKVSIYTIFFIVGFIIWAETTSYGSRNALWLHVFIIVGSSYFFRKNEVFNEIMFLKLDIKELFNKIKILILKSNLKYIFVLFIFYILWPSDRVVKFIQAEQQKRFGNPISAQNMVHLLKGKETTCLKIYTNSQKTKYNYYVKNLFDKIEQFGGKPSNEILVHNCIEGRYIHMPYMPSDKEFNFEEFKIKNNLKYIGFDDFYFVEHINKDYNE